MPAMTAVNRLKHCRCRAAIAAVAAFVVPMAAATATATATAQDQLLGTFKDWTAVSYQDGDRTVCYTVSKPQKSEGNYSRRGPVYVQVTRRAEQGGDVASFEAGYPFRESSQAEIRIGEDVMTLFTKGQAAWTYDDAADQKLVEAMRKGTTMIVLGVSARGTNTTDSYSLIGFADAHNAVREACK